MLFDFTFAELAFNQRYIALLLRTLGSEAEPDDLARPQSAALQGRPERRSAKRQPIAVPISLVPVDDQLRPTGEGFRATTRDISASGLSYLHDREEPGTRLVAQFVLPNVGTLKLLIEVVRTVRCDPLYLTGAKFLTSPDT